MDRPHDLRPLGEGGDRADRARDLAHLRVVLAPVRGDEDDRALRIEAEQRRCWDAAFAHAPFGGQEGVDHGVARNEDVGVLRAFGEQVRARLRKLCANIRVMVGVARPGLPPRCGGGQCGRRRRRRIAVYEHDVGPPLGEHALHPDEDAGRDVGQRLRPRHDVEVDVGNDLEQAQDVVQHLAVLRGDAHQRFDLGTSALQRMDHRRHLDRVRPRPHDGQHAQRRVHASLTPA